MSFQDAIQKALASGETELAKAEQSMNQQESTPEEDMEQLHQAQENTSPDEENDDEDEEELEEGEENPEQSMSKAVQGDLEEFDAAPILKAIAKSLRVLTRKQKVLETELGEIRKAQQQGAESQLAIAKAYEALSSSHATLAKASQGFLNFQSSPRLSKSQQAAVQVAVRTESTTMTAEEVMAKAEQAYTEGQIDAVSVAKIEHQMNAFGVEVGLQRLQATAPDVHKLITRKGPQQ